MTLTFAAPQGHVPQGGRESRPQGEGAQVVRMSSEARYA
jgi:hypothetical protein